MKPSHAFYEYVPQPSFSHLTFFFFHPNLHRGVDETQRLFDTDERKDVSCA